MPPTHRRLQTQRTLKLMSSRVYVSQFGLQEQPEAAVFFDFMADFSKPDKSLIAGVPNLRHGNVFLVQFNRGRDPPTDKCHQE